MNKTSLLMATSVLALCASGVLATAAARPLLPAKANLFKMTKAARVLWNQNSNDSGENVTSENFTSTASTYNDQAADDFVIPKAKVWKIAEIDVAGGYGGGGAPAHSENVTFYKDANGRPGIKKAEFNNLQGVDSNGNFAITLPNGGVRFKTGHYWVSVVANMEYGTGLWGWELNATQHRDLAMWQNPLGGLGACERWCTLESIGYSAPDLMFELKGVARAK